MDRRNFEQKLTQKIVFLPTVHITISALPLIGSTKPKPTSEAPIETMGQSIYHKQLMKFRKLLNPSELQTTLMLRTLPKLMLINLESLDDLPRMGQALKQELHQQVMFNFSKLLFILYPRWRLTLLAFYLLT